nr:reverse transcriptase domain-containing protein [Tanacetum cinerariifolium]
MSKYSYNDAESIHRIDVIDVACEEYVQKVLGFSDNAKSGNPTPISDPIIALSSPSLTPFEGGDFILEEIKAYLTSEPSSLFDFEEVMNNNQNQEPPPQNGPPPMFHGLPSDDANQHIDKFLEITQHIKQNEVSDDALRLSLLPYSLTRHAIAWYDRLPRNSIHSFDDMMRKCLSKYFPPFIVTKLWNEITKFEQKPHESLFEACLVTNCQLTGVLAITCF